MRILKKLIICIITLIGHIIIVGIKTLEFTIFGIIIAIPIVILVSIPNGIHTIIPVIPDLLSGLLMLGFICGIIDILYLKSILKKRR